MDPHQHVTAVITHRVRAGREEGYEAWIKGISAAARGFDGHLGVHILRPQRGGGSPYVIVLQFDTCAHLTAWLRSEERRSWIERVSPLISEQESIQVLTGLEAWFQLPGEPARPAPRRWKQALLVWLGVSTLALLVSPHVNVWLAAWPWVLRVVLNAGITVALLTYAVMPFLTRRLQGWLYSG
ncbi:antibiotic biosynthesis monooxygenase [Cyanobium sp. NIES-981]|uniref:antibiotic biosynthesis monooxygenase n=1 Tax=Cyanobium sp. NIES-981 TaxID=1851505 RepID=UPI000B3580B6|nr:antibiotic biosynthesis monooxygenase [Cyanobium sp. NIES-981]